MRRSIFAGLFFLGACGSSGTAQPTSELGPGASAGTDAGHQDAADKAKIPGTCSGRCAAVAAPACPNDDPLARCVAECQGILTALGARCAEERDAYLACASAAVASCGAGGKAVLDACAIEEAAFLGCAANAIGNKDRDPARSSSDADIGAGTSDAGVPIVSDAAGTPTTPVRDAAPGAPDAFDPPRPDIVFFKTNRSDRFLVDVATIDTGLPYRGKRAKAPHSGGHVQWDNTNNKWPRGGSAPLDYPKVYAVADGVISRVDHYVQVGTNYRYGADLAFASSGGKSVVFVYSIEPMIDPGDPNFYKPYLFVTPGRIVHKGDVIGTVYVPPHHDGSIHVHFNLQLGEGGAPMSPTIFTDEVMNAFHDHWGGAAIDSLTGMGPAIPKCMGFMLDPTENPFGSGAVDCQN